MTNTLKFLVGVDMYKKVEDFTNIEDLLNGFTLEDVQNSIIKYDEIGIETVEMLVKVLEEQRRKVVVR